MFKCVIFALFIAYAIALPKDLSTEDFNGIVLDSSRYIKKNAELQDVIGKRIEYKLLGLFSKRGRMDLTNGWVEHLDSYELKRSVKRLDSNRYEIPLKFRKLRFVFDYDVDMDIIGNHGTLYGILEDLDMAITVSIQNNSIVMYGSPKFHINDFDVEFKKGSFIMDPIYNHLSQTFKEILEDMIKDEYVTFVAELVVKEMNESAKLM